MGDRYSRKDAYTAFTRLASALGKTWSDDHGNLWKGQAYDPTALIRANGEHVGIWTRSEDGKHLLATVGAWTLDYNPTYGGFVVEEIFNDGGGVSRPMGDMRRNAREFCDAVRFAMDALRQVSGANLDAVTRSR